MQQAATATPSPTFAGLLAALAAPAPTATDGPPAWNDDDLADDVATLSYERALRARARYRAADATDRSLTEPPDPGTPDIRDAFPAEAASVAETATSLVAPLSSADVEPEVTHDLSTAPERNVKSASVTIRLSSTEYAQLRVRAAEAGLTVSAYLRSCTFEAESLRALVKDTLAKLRSDPSPGKQAACAPARRGWLRWLARPWPRTRDSQDVARA